jgi:hypothetical protein
MATLLSAVLAREDLTAIPRDVLRRVRHELANRIQPALWAGADVAADLALLERLDAELTRRDAEAMLLHHPSLPVREVAA